MRKILLFTLSLCLLSSIATAQEDNSSSKDKGEKITQTFKDTRVINGHSVETNKEGSMKFIIMHRFGALNSGVNELFGLDQANMRIGFDYGIKDWLTIGLGRSSTPQKVVDLFGKARVLDQYSNGSPVSISLFASAAARTVEDPRIDASDYFKARMFYSYQALIARKFSERLSLQLMPSFVHRNLVRTTEEENDIISIGAAGHFQVTKVVGIQTEVYFTPDDFLTDEYSNSISIGLDFETKNHVFQIHLTNSQGMVEKDVIGETRGRWDEGDIFLGFNFTRDFQIKGRKYK